ALLGYYKFILKKLNELVIDQLIKRPKEATLQEFPGDSEELVPVTHYVRAIITGTSVEKKGDP
ncbi:hypothetical protein HAX54_003782, partial [Datura stramonium]|nr:hypothetical protein [Datura stramonium]